MFNVSTSIILQVRNINRSDGNADFESLIVMLRARKNQFVKFLFKLFLVIEVLILCASNSLAEVSQSVVLKKVSFDEIPRQIIFDPKIFENKSEILSGISRTLRFLKSEKGKEAYRAFERIGISNTRVEQTLARFYLILMFSNSPAELEKRIRRTFDLYRSVGADGRGTVKFTGYFQPVYKASPVRTKEYRYPIFRKPADFDSWKLPHPTRVELEGYDGLGRPGTLLHGNEIAFLRNRFEAFMIHVQGSAILQFPDGTTKAIGFDAGTRHPFRGISRKFLKENHVAWNKLDKFFIKHPDKLDQVLSRNNRFIFFKEREVPQPLGSLGVPVIPERSIAIDKLKLPPGALSIIRTRLPEEVSNGKLALKPASRFVLSLDSGSAIKGPGRVDVFMGTGDKAQKKANTIFGPGELYYLMMKQYDDLKI
ncbi:MAG: murein transglycosylase [Candidatus Dadabacteria bacterium]|nr:MAG: murein transglycosylase [Candidatus Dadabacteria bacterium]